MFSKVVNSYKVNAFKSKEDFLNLIKDQKKILIAMNAEKILKEDERLRDIINNNIGYPDGVGAVMALKQKGLDAIKIPGSEFWLDIVSAFHKEKSFYILGTTADVIENTVSKLKEEFPNINIIGYRDGFLKDDDKEKLQATLITLKPDVVFVAQGSPRQEFLMDELIKIHPALYMGLGGSFDIYGGDKKRAPKLFLDFHLEWLYRLFKEPTRVGRQLNLIKFLFLLKVGKL
jgi:UDP-N-acetyl-D-mannosaminouronate:lipid I N-acetyl-D-mannosaminouronosyltransferase